MPGGRRPREIAAAQAVFRQKLLHPTSQWLGIPEGRARFQIVRRAALSSPNLKQLADERDSAKRMVICI